MLDAVGGIFAILVAIVSLLTVIIKVNSTMVSLKDAVEVLTAFIKDQAKLNDNFNLQFRDHEVRIRLMEQENNFYKEDDAK